MLVVCCIDFLFALNRKGSFRLGTVMSERGPTYFCVEIEGGKEIQFCPWCGKAPLTLAK